jgi:probable HAF family extracellular repeat protein
LRKDITMNHPKKLLAVTASCAFLLQGAVCASGINPLENEDIVTSHIAPHVTIQDGFQASRVCQAWKKIWDSNMAWQSYAQRLPGYERALESKKKKYPGAQVDYKAVFNTIITPSFILLDTLNSGNNIRANAMSADGRVVVGVAQDGQAGNATRAFRRTEAQGLKFLGTLNGGRDSEATAVSADGRVVVGVAEDGQANNASRAFRWIPNQDLHSLGTFNDGSESTATAVSADGRVIVGMAHDGQAHNDSRAFRWTQEDGLHSLGTLNGGRHSFATAVNADGRVIVGEAEDGQENATRAFIWYNEEIGMILLHKPLVSILPSDVTLDSAKHISADGTIVIGKTKDPAVSWSAYIPRYDVLAREGINLLQQ